MELLVGGFPPEIAPVAGKYPPRRHSQATPRVLPFSIFNLKRSKEGNGGIQIFGIKKKAGII